jgi:hypothetical protein
MEQGSRIVFPCQYVDIGDGPNVVSHDGTPISEVSCLCINAEVCAPRRDDYGSFLFSGWRPQVFWELIYLVLRRIPSNSTEVPGDDSP